MGEKKQFTGWWILVVALLIVSMIIFTGLSYFGIIGETVVERIVFENSYQKKEADKTANTIYAAQLAQLRGRLNNPNLDEGTKTEIEAQIDAINILKQTKGD